MSIILNPRKYILARYLILYFGLLLLSCNNTPKQVKEKMPEETPLNKKKEMEKNTTTVEFVLTGRSLQQPPKEDLIFDVKLNNQTNASKWVLIPSTCKEDLTFQQGGHTVEFYKSCDQGCLTYAHLLGVESFYLFLLKSNTSASIKDLPITIWQAEEQPISSITLSALVTSDFNIDAVPFSDWIDIDWQTDENAVVSIKKTEIQGAKYQPDLKTMPIELKAYKEMKTIIKL